jgi:hypothetical protein
MQSLSCVPKFQLQPVLGSSRLVVKNSQSYLEVVFGSRLILSLLSLVRQLQVMRCRVRNVRRSRYSTGPPVPVVGTKVHGWPRFPWRHASERLMKVLGI